MLPNVFYNLFNLAMKCVGHSRQPVVPRSKWIVPPLGANKIITTHVDHTHHVPPHVLPDCKKPLRHILELNRQIFRLRFPDPKVVHWHTQATAQNHGPRAIMLKSAPLHLPSIGYNGVPEDHQRPDLQRLSRVVLGKIGYGGPPGGAPGHAGRQARRRRLRPGSGLVVLGNGAYVADLGKMLGGLVVVLRDGVGVGQRRGGEQDGGLEAVS
mmetsp:Transcript_11991/g.26534  ORF Transcript_11991/g.26534 Transcript_11991/m.26534 type:complete len:211 (+) Transcript_11991:538-1170(+)